MKGCKMFHKPKKYAFVSSVLLLAACGTVQQTTVSSATGVTRAQKFSIPAAQFNAASANAYMSLLSSAKQQGVLNTDKVLTKRVRLITDRLVQQAPILRPDSGNWPWQVAVLSSDELNAACYPDGKMFIYSGLITRLKLTDDEIAQVMGHEISHALREHSREGASQQQSSNLLVGLLDVAGQVAGYKGVGDLANVGAQVGFNLPFNRAHETEADQMGIEIAARAGYNPDAAVSLWRKMQAESGTGGSDFFSTHPSSSDRQANLAALADTVRPLYLSAKKK
jgi:predicted Zn-dependent protease